MTDLLPCPFCGSGNLRYQFAGSQGYIECNECGTEGPCDEQAADPICDDEAAYNAWNRRAALAQPEPKGATDGELLDWASYYGIDYVDAHRPSELDAEKAPVRSDELCIFARAAIAVDRARWGRPATAQPEPVGATDEELETTARAAEIQYIKEHGGLAASTPDGIHAQLQAQRLAGLRAVAARYARARAYLAQPEPQGVKLIYRYSPVTIAECGGPCEQGPEYCDCGEIKGEPEPQGATDEAYGSELISFARAVLARWGRPAIKPVPVSERLPEPGVKVLAHYLNSHGKSRTVCARWIPAKFESSDPETDDLLEYDEDSDAFYWPEGWYETIENWDDYGSIMVNEGEVTHWLPLPHWALPVPQQEATDGP